MTFEQYLEEVQATFQKWSTASNPWRLGQTYFNVLCELRPDLSERIRTTDLDPFYRDQIIPEFLNWVGEQWNIGTQKKIPSDQPKDA